MVVKCKRGTKLNKKTNRCNKIKCPKNKILNKKTNRCKSFALTKREERYCRCITKLRNKGVKVPYAICTNSVYNLQGFKRTRNVPCSLNYNFEKFSKSQLINYVKVRKIKYNKSATKRKLINLINHKLKTKYL
jgi:hypothetical protein